MKQLVVQNIKYALVVIASVCLVISATIIIPNLATSKTARAATTGECGADQDTSAMNSKVVTWGGKKWIVVGTNANGVTRGVAGPSDTVTLLLEGSSGNADSTMVNFGGTPYNSQTLEPPHFNPEYNTSSLKDYITQTYEVPNTANLAQIEPRTIKGSMSEPFSATGFGADDAYGRDTPNQYFWSLSLAEASQLKGNVRVYNTRTPWWTRTPANFNSDPTNTNDTLGKEIWVANLTTAGYGSSGGHMMYNTDTLTAHQIPTIAARPAFYLKYSTYQTLTGGSDALSSINIGSCPVYPQIKLGGKTWDIVGTNNNGTSAGTSLGGSNTATLLLSNRSRGKFDFSGSGQIDAPFDTTNTSTDWSSSTIKQRLDEFVNVLADSNIVPRNLTDVNANAQKIWLLSLTETQQLDLSTRLFVKDWWVRNAKDATHNYAVLYDGYAGGDRTGANPWPNSQNYTVRPAMLYQLTDEIKYYWANREASWNGMAYKNPVDASCFSYTPPSVNLQYDNTPKSASVALSGTCNLAGGVSAPTVFYTGINGTSYIRQVNAPTLPGDYMISVDGAESANYGSYSDIDLGQFTISKRILTPKIEWKNSYYSWCGGTPSVCGHSIEFNGTNNAIRDGVHGISYGATTAILDVTISANEGLLASDTLNRNSTNVALGRYNQYDASVGCYRVPMIRDTVPYHDYTNANAEANKSLEVMFQKNVSADCADIWSKYDFNIPSVQRSNGGMWDVYIYPLADAGSIVPAPNQLQVKTNDVSIAAGGNLPNAQTLTAQITGGRIAGDTEAAGNSADNPYQNFTGSLEYSTDARCQDFTTPAVLSGCILQGTLGTQNYSGISTFTTGDIIVGNPVPVKPSPTAANYDISGLSQNYSGTAKSVTVTAKAGYATPNSVYYAGSGTTTYAKSTTPPTNAGTYTVTFDVPENATYAAIADLPAGILTISKINQAPLTLLPTTSQTQYSPSTSIALTSSGGSGTGSLTYTCVSGDCAAVSIMGDSLYSIGVGTVILRSEKAGDDNYNAAISTNTESITISPRQLTVIGLTVDNKEFDGTTAAIITNQGQIGPILPPDTASDVQHTCSGATFADMAVGDDKPVTIASCTLSGAKSAFYSVTPPTNIKANITAPPTPPTPPVPPVPPTPPTPPSKQPIAVNDIVVNSTPPYMFDGLQHGVSVSLPAGTGTLTMKYENASYPISSTEPTFAGAYKVLVSVTEGTLYQATAQDIYIGDMIIGKRSANVRISNLTIAAGSLPNPSSLSYTVDSNGLDVQALTPGAINGALAINPACDVVLVGVKTGCIYSSSGFSDSSGNYNIANAYNGDLIVTSTADELVDDVNNGGANTGIILRGVGGYQISSTMKLVVDVKDSVTTRTVFTDFDASIGSNNALDSLYDIHLVDMANGNAPVNFDGSDQIQVVLPEVMSDLTSQYKLHHLHSTDITPFEHTSQRIIGTKSIHFTTTKLSLFGISYAAVGVPDVPATNPDISAPIVNAPDPDLSTSSAISSASIAVTGSALFGALYLLILLLISATTLYYTRKYIMRANE